MAIQTVYYRHKTDGTAGGIDRLGVGRRPEAAKNGPYFIRVRDGAGKYQWVKHDTEAAAKKAAKLAPVARQAQELGLTVDELTNDSEHQSRFDQNRRRKLSARPPFRSAAIHRRI